MNKLQEKLTSVPRRHQLFLRLFLLRWELTRLQIHLLFNISMVALLIWIIHYFILRNHHRNLYLVCWVKGIQWGLFTNNTQALI